jgi:hypothetical protein
MYAALWRALPGPWPVRLLVLAALAAAVVAGCFLWAFPALDPYMPFNQQTVEEESP